jgi:hypothetical protein
MVLRFFNLCFFFLPLHFLNFFLVPINQLIQLDTTSQHDRVGTADGVESLLELLFPGGDLLFEGCDCLKIGFSHGQIETNSFLDFAWLFSF